ncbi:MAG: polymer-forming cytoskeletal protein [Lachnospiraceae bacterium]|nr:polymer-forming cytoskeletal protein [Lachnospiraceae bacterium]
MESEVKEEALEKPEKASEAGIETVKEPETEEGEQDRTSKNIPEKENASNAIEQLKKMNAKKENKMSQEKDIISINAVEEDKDIKEETKEEVREEIREEESFNADEADTETTYITKGTKINGDLETDGSIDIIGTVDGNISCKGKVVVGGHVIGDISAGEVYANNAKVEGSIKSYGSVKVGVGSMVIGSVGGESAVIAGAVNGDIDVKGPVIVDSTAVIMGNIKSRSVQINNGAVIEGFCSQSYSDIDVKSFFA